MKEPSKEYITWIRIKARCYNPKSTRFENYGGRGIKMFSVTWAKGQVLSIQ